MEDIKYVRLWTEPEERRIALCQSFYHQVYLDCFPDPDEAEDPSIWLPLLRADPPPGKQRIFLIAACKGRLDPPGDEVVGGIVFELYRKSGAWLATYIAVREDQRRLGIGQHLFDEMVRAIGEAAATPDWHLFAEAENPMAFEGRQREAAYHRLAILSQFGLLRLPIDYIQPALTPSKRQLNTLVLLYMTPNNDRRGPRLATERVISFLTEFYASLDQLESPSLRRMVMQIEASGRVIPEPLEVPARYDHTLGQADAITIRLTFLAHYLRDLGVAPISDTKEVRADTWGDIRLGDLEPEAGGNLITPSHLLRLSEPFGSFHRDITIPYASGSNLPLVIQCQMFREEGGRIPGASAPPTVRITFPETIKMMWEGEPQTIRFGAPGEGSRTIDAKLVDTVAIFDSGYLAYSVALVLGKLKGDRPILNAAETLALAAVAEPAGRMVGEPVRLALEAGQPKPIHVFLRDRLRSLFRMSHLGSCTVFSALAAANQNLGNAISRALLTMRFPDPTQLSDAANTKASVSIEVIGLTRHDLVLRAGAQAVKREAPLTAFTRRLAGLAQNVLDFQRQDEGEIHDSLAEGFRLGEELTFAHKDLAIRFSRSSRAFDEMWAIAGGEPYWLLVEILTCHNSKLLLDLNEDLRKEKRLSETYTTMSPLLANISAEASSEELRVQVAYQQQRAQSRRMRIAHYIPNIFRYPTERELCDAFARARGLPVQRQFFSEFESTIERMHAETTQLKAAIAEASERESGENRNYLLIAIGVVQATGVFAGFASVFAAIASMEDKFSTVGEEVKRETPAFGKLIASVMKGAPIADWPVSEWGLVLTVGWICASIFFAAAVTLIFIQRRFGNRAACRTLGTVAVIVAAIAVLFRTVGSPMLYLLILLCLIATITPVVLILLWRQQPPQRKSRRTI